MIIKLTRKERNRAMDMLLVARMQHTRWVAEVKEEKIPKVEEDPTRCEFGRWLLGSEDYLGDFPAFKALHRPHDQLHDAYKQLLKSGGSETDREAVLAYSKQLIDAIDQLEKDLKYAQIQAD